MSSNIRPIDNSHFGLIIITKNEPCGLTEITSDGKALGCPIWATMSMYYLGVEGKKNLPNDIVSPLQP
jgi:hypothetical protein